MCVHRPVKIERKGGTVLCTLLRASFVHTLASSLRDALLQCVDERQRSSTVYEAACVMINIPSSPLPFRTSGGLGACECKMCLGTWSGGEQMDECVRRGWS